jgi:RNA-directed DNA polymerase
MLSRDLHLTIHNLGLIQRQAGVDPEVAELVVAYGRMMVDSGRLLSFDSYPFPQNSCEQEVLNNLSEHNHDVDPRFLRFLAAWSGEMKRFGRTPIFSRDNFAQHLQMSPGELREVIQNRASYYRITRLPKRNGTFRVIHCPRSPLRKIQEWILRSVLARVQPSSVAHGFIKGRSIVTNAAQHLGRMIVLSVDIEGFFPSVKFTVVRKAFQRLGYPYSVAVDLAGLSTLDGALPQGAPTSPALSNLACFRLDKRLEGLAHSLKHTYSRYADDLTFSSDDDRLPSILPLLREILAEEGFHLSEKKTHIYRSHHRQDVNGIVVN